MSVDSETRILDSVKYYYGKELTCTADVKTPECIDSEGKMTQSTKHALSAIHDEVINRYYGCGTVIPEKLEGMKVLDLGSGSGRDCFVLSKLVGQDGQVTGIDMTDEQLAISRKYIEYHTEKFGYSKQNVKFVKGYIEKLSEAGIEPESMDIIVSNCVLCLSPDKKAVLEEAYRALKVGGELYFGSLYADRILPDDLKKDELLWGVGISGALWWEELYNIAEEVGFSVPRLVTAKPIRFDREEFIKLIGDTKYICVTYRLFKLPKKPVGQTQAVYRGGIKGFEEVLDFDHQTKFKRGDLRHIDSEMATILQCSRFSSEFDFKPVNESVSNEANHSPPKSSKVDPFTFKGNPCSGKKTVCSV